MTFEIQRIFEDATPLTDFNLTQVADQDQMAIAAWLHEFKRKPNTLRAYTREAKRFWLWWTTVRANRSLREIHRADLNRYIDLLSNPPPTWVATGSVQSSSSKSNWRPFKGPLTLGSKRQALIILQSLFDYLLHSGHLDTNPARLIRDKGPAPQRAARQVPSEESFFKFTAWVKKYSNTQPIDLKENFKQKLAARDIFIWEWIYWTAARRHELSNSLLSSVQAQTHLGQTRWWWNVLGKGEKKERIPLDKAAVEALASSLEVSVEGLSAVLAEKRDFPLVPALRGETRSACISQIYASICRVAALAASQENKADLMDEGIESTDVVVIVATRPHALRAYRNTHLFNAGVDPRFIQRFMRHADFNTTLIYDHTHEQIFHDALIK
jgi:site-specific recombinase XerD